ncbi:sugar ABC transporter substrate-binding protein [Streptomyces griseorubiginosus]|uniref:sugar ABC transporter substrate-binding protein n=1 Tax=Streptomyces griseorubiginosus TaxID=67304 RepID=UPI001AD6C18F|nr:sugar ABC transporter substrate-binding protein [Streptomyces griseorubiginosus]MBO4253286.1 extracellular solute-binding protein [Streptomyces griseorubiginosus]
MLFRSHLVRTVVVGSVATLLLTGCGRTDTRQKPGSAGSPIDSSPATGTITVWAMGTEGELLPKLAAGFEKANTDAKVKVTAVPWQDYGKKVETAIASGDTPDATLVGAADIAMFATTGGLEQVPPKLVDDAAFYPGAARSSAFEGATYGVPWYVETRSLFYRKDLAQAANVSAPKTWDEYGPFLKALQKQGAKWGLSLPTGAAQSWQGVLPFMWQAGARLTNDGGTAFTFDTPEALKGLEFYQSFFTSKTVSRNGPVSLGEIEPQFVAGSTAALISGPWEESLLKSAGGASFVADKVGIAPLPAGPDSNASYMGGGQWTVFKDAKNRETAWKFIRWMAQPEQQKAWYGLSGDLPAVQSAWKQGKLATDPALKVFQTQLKTAQPGPTTTTWKQVTAVVDAEIEKVAKGVTSPKAALEQIQSKAAAIGTGNKR